MVASALGRAEAVMRLSPADGEPAAAAAAGRVLCRAPMPLPPGQGRSPPPPACHDGEGFPEVAAMAPRQAHVLLLNELGCEIQFWVAERCVEEGGCGERAATGMRGKKRRMLYKHQTNN
jgi:hypothetical protein